MIKLADFEHKWLEMYKKFTNDFKGEPAICPPPYTKVSPMFKPTVTPDSQDTYTSNSSNQSSQLPQRLYYNNNSPKIFEGTNRTGGKTTPAFQQFPLSPNIKN